MADLFKVRALEAFRNQNADMIVVEVPELSEGLDEPVKVHFKTELTVEEHLEYMDGIGAARNSLHLAALSNALLFSLCVCDEDGKPLVEKAKTVKDATGKDVTESSWVASRISGKLVQELAKRADLHEAVLGRLDPFRQMLEDGSKGEEGEKKTPSSSSIKSPSEAEQP